MNKRNIITDRRGLEFRSAFFALIAMSTVIIAAGVIVGNWSADYNSGVTYGLGEYNNLNEIAGTAEDQRGDISVKSPTPRDTDFEGTSLRGVFGLLNNIYSSFNLVFGDNGMIDSVTSRFGIPNYLSIALITIMVMAITFALIAIFFKLNRRAV